MSTTIAVQLDALDALAGDLAVLSADLVHEAERCASAAAALYGGLSDDTGLDAGWAAGTWSTLARAVADGTHVVADTLAAAVTAYRAADEARAASIAGHLLELVAVAW